MSAMNALERAIDTRLPEASVYLRLLKKRLQGDLTLRIMDQLVRPSDIVIDVGAYRGVYTLKLANLVGRGGTVWAVEPLPDNRQALMRMWGERRPWRRRPNVHVLPYGVTDTAATGQLHLPVVDGRTVASHASLGQLDVEHQTIEVDLRRLDELIPEMTKAVAFIKMDVEGFEHEALLGAERLLTNDQPNVFVEIEQRHRQRPVEETFDLLRGWGYEGYFVLGSHLRPLAEFELSRHQPPELRSFSAGDMPAEYVHDFLFTRPWSGRSLDPLLHEVRSPSG